MLFTLCLDGEAREGGRELLTEWRSQADSWLWVDLQDEPAATETDLLCNGLSLDAHAVAEAQRPRHPPGFDAFPDHVYLLLKSLTAETDDLEFSTQQMAIFVSDRLLVTRHNLYSRFLDLQHQRLREDGCDGDSPLGFLAAIARRVAERYGRILLDLERRLTSFEEIDLGLHLGDHRDEPVIGIMCEPEGHGVEDVAKHPRLRQQHQPPLGAHLVLPQHLARPGRPAPLPRP